MERYLPNAELIEKVLPIDALYECVCVNLKLYFEDLCKYRPFTIVCVHVVVCKSCELVVLYVNMLCTSFVQVLIAQEKMATNTVYVFAKKDSKYAYTAECRSCLENSSRPTSTIWVSMMARGGQVSPRDPAINIRSISSYWWTSRLV